MLTGVPLGNVAGADVFAVTGGDGGAVATIGVGVGVGASDRVGATGGTGAGVEEAAGEAGVPGDGA